MSTYVMTDIHGHYKEFLRMLKMVNFDTKKDRIVSLGDMVDRGPNPLEVINFFYNSTYAISLKGNHEFWLTEFYDAEKNNFENGTYYYNTPRILKQCCSEHQIEMYMEWMKGLHVQTSCYVGGRRFLLAHGATYSDSGQHTIEDYCNPDGDWYENILSNETEQSYISIVGHLPTSSLYMYGVRDAVPGKIYHSKNGKVIFLDCGAAYPELESSQLSCIRLEDLEEFYVRSER